MIILGIVGSEQAKFTAQTEILARRRIAALILAHGAWKVVSGACHLGGIDTWAIEVAKAMGCVTEEFPPKNHSWSSGYRPRNIQIANACHKVCCITLRTLPETYTGMKFKECYHCRRHELDRFTRENIYKEHVKSGGCWTMWYKKEYNPENGELHII